MTLTMIGDPRRFAMAFASVANPDANETRPERIGSWGKFQLWVGARNLTAGITQNNIQVDAAECPLLPLVQWFVEGWEILFHETRLPRAGAFASSADWHVRSLGNVERDEQIVEARLTWWKHHGLGAALPDYRIPDLHFRRMDDSVELSWDDAEWKSVPTGVVLTEGPGAYPVPAESVTQTVFEWCSAVLDTCAGTSNAELIASLRGALLALRSPGRRTERLRLATGLPLPVLERAARSQRKMAGLDIDDESLETTMRAMLGLSRNSTDGGLFAPMTVPVLMYRSCCPDLSEGDLDQLLRLAQREDPAVPEFANLRRPKGCPLQRFAATQSGCDLALDLRDALQIPEDEPLVGEHDLERVILKRLGISVVQIALTDRATEGASIYVEGRAPRIAVNAAGRYSQTEWGRRMTLAHEICHLLHDGIAGRGVGLVSNPWAPSLLERRANVFAVNLLIPPSVLDATIPPNPSSWDSDILRDAMRKLGVGAHTFFRQLQHLRWIDENEALDWISVLATQRPS